MAITEPCKPSHILSEGVSLQALVAIALSKVFKLGGKLAEQCQGQPLRASPWLRPASWAPLLLYEMYKNTPALVCSSQLNSRRIQPSHSDNSSARDKNWDSHVSSPLGYLRTCSESQLLNPAVQVHRLEHWSQPAMKPHQRCGNSRLAHRGGGHAVHSRV